MYEKDDFEIVNKLCSTILTKTNPLGITKNEAINIMEAIVKSNDFIEEMRKTKNNRREVEIVRNIYIKKYFETLGHNGIVERMAFDNGSKYAFSGGADGIIKCWNIEEGMLIRSLYGHSNMISDLCISKNGKIMVSVDYQGKLNIWSLFHFKILHSIQLTNEAIFCEFIYRSTRPVSKSEEELSANEDNKYEIFIILSDGIVKTLQFTESKIGSEKINYFMSGENIKAICITDGGRFVICGGWWPFFLIYDTQDLDSIIVVENFRIQTLCAAKNALKFSASTGNQIYSYTYHSECVSKNELHKRKSGVGCWNKNVHYINNEYFVEWLCYLPSFLLVASCTDNIIRIYEDDKMVFSFSSEVGSIYSHATKDIFAVVGTKLKIYQLTTSSESHVIKQDEMVYTFGTINKEERSVSCFSIDQDRNQMDSSFKAKLIYSETIYINLNDCQFSEDGKYLITCDDQGYIRAYSVENPIKVPEEQFFKKDIETVLNNMLTNNINGNLNSLLRNATDDAVSITNNSNSNAVPNGSASVLLSSDYESNMTLNINGQTNYNWKKTQYSITEVQIPENIEIENMAAISLEKDKLKESKFRSLYLCGDQSIVNLPEDEVKRQLNASNDMGSNDKTYVFTDLSDFESSSDRSSGNNKDEDDESSPICISRRNSIKSLAVKGSSTINSLVKNLRRRRRRETRREIITDDSSNFTVSEKSPKPQRSSNKIRKLKKFKRRLSTRRIVNSSSDASTIEISEISERSNRKASGPILRRNLRDNILSQADESFSEEIKTTRRLLRKDIKQQAKNKDDLIKKINHSGSPQKKEILNESPNKTRQLDLDTSISSVFSSSGIRLRSSYRNLKKSINDNETDDSNISDNIGIDKTLENSLSSFATNWLKHCSIYENTDIYFDATSYKKFLDLEPRIGPIKSIPKSGFYTVTNLKLEYIGKIPFLSISLNKGKFKVKLYEYYDSPGIICTKDQYLIKNRDSVYVYLNNGLKKGIILKTSEMSVLVDKTWYLKSCIAIKYNTLDASPIDIPMRSSKPLFGLDRNLKNNLSIPIDYSCINFKIENGLYKCKKDLIYDLKSVYQASKSLKSTLATIAYNVYKDFQ